MAFLCGRGGKTARGYLPVNSEAIEGFVQSYNHQDPLVQVVPVRFDSNNQEIFCSRTAIRRIDWQDKKSKITTIRTEDYL